MTTPDTARSPNPVDKHVGARLRQRRKVLGLSQEKLAEGLKLTFQQVQKYERGANRVSASKLYDASHVLGVPVSYFFEGLPQPNEHSEAAEKEVIVQAAVTALLDMPEGLDIASNFPRISRGATRRHVAALIRTLATAEEEEACAG